MKIELRGYQSESVQQTAWSMRSGIKRPLIIAPTASGKSIIIAEMVRRVLEKDATGEKRILILCHQGDLLAQNETMIKKLDFNIDTGIFCAGQGRKETTNRVILASRGSLKNNPTACGKFDLAICDEAHAIPKDALTDKEKETGYSQIFQALLIPYVVGLTGTPWRKAKGLIYGKGSFFEECSYEIKMRDLIDAGYLCDYILPNVETVIDASKVKVSSTGDFNIRELDEVSAPEEVVRRCLDIWRDKAFDRKVSIFFACSRVHGKVISDMLEDEYVDPELVAYIDGETKPKVRKQMLEDIKQGKYKCVVNVDVLTTGYDAPIIDCVVWLRATMSTSLFVQMGGRGLRLYPGKENCLMLDMAGNFERFNSLEEPIGDGDNGNERKKADATPKKCIKCKHENPGHLKFCVECGDKLPCLAELTKKCTNKECEEMNFPAATKCRECDRIFINHDSNAHTVKGGAIDRHVVTKHIWIRGSKDKNGNEYLKLRVTAYIEGRLSYLTETYWKNIFKFSKDTQDILDNMDTKNPHIIQTWVNKKGYKEVNILEWKDKTEQELDECQHEYTQEMSPGFRKILVCGICGDLK